MSQRIDLNPNTSSAADVRAANPTATEYAIEKYTPAKTVRRGIGLCLSGGGFRATLFHLGALRRLNELGILARDDFRTISSVSGGSITAAHLAATVNWSLRYPAADWEKFIAEPLRSFTKRDLRTGAIFKRLWPWNWVKGSVAVEELAKRIEKNLTNIRLKNLPDHPRFAFCATDMAFAVNWVFEKTGMGDYQVGHIMPVPEDWPLARSVAASACFPPVFNPMRMPFKADAYVDGKARATDERKWREAVSDLRLTDGGNYDSMGLEPVWKDHAIVLVSDAGSPLDFSSDGRLIWRLQRYVTIQAEQASALRKRWLISNFIAGVMDGAYWGISSARTSYDPQDRLGYSKELASDVIAGIRTDLDAFSEAEAAVLENHGYLLADAAIRKHVPEILPGAIQGVAVPHKDWCPPQKTEGQVREALKGSDKRKIFGRG